MTKNPLDIIERASDILRALKKGVLVTAKAGDKVNSMVIEWRTSRNSQPLGRCAFAGRGHRWFRCSGISHSHASVGQVKGL